MESDLLIKPWIQEGTLTQQELVADILSFTEFGKATQSLEFLDRETNIPVFVNEFWTSKQRAAHSLHEISYRACFKPQLPRFFISRLTKSEDIVYDPFMGRGTTILEAALLRRRPVGCDINPLCKILVSPRLNPPELPEIIGRLNTINLRQPTEIWQDLLVFYHPTTLLHITNLRNYLIRKQESGTLDCVDAWIRMVATNRLTGHSSGFFSVYTMPPNQAVSIESQKKINEKRRQIPPERDIVEIILRKSRSLLSELQPNDIENLRKLTDDPLIITASSDNTPQLSSDSVALVVTSPPFLDTVNYQADNWLRCWFNNFNAQDVNIWQLRRVEDWQDAMKRTFTELKRVLKPGGHIAFEVGEVRNGKVLLESLVVPAAKAAGLIPLMILINDQIFTKTSNCWGVDNIRKGTNTNRIVLITKPEKIEDTRLS
jgi:hypothetical protein